MRPAEEVLRELCRMAEDKGLIVISDDRIAHPALREAPGYRFLFVRKTYHSKEVRAHDLATGIAMYSEKEDERQKAMVEALTGIDPGSNFIYRTYEWVVRTFASLAPRGRRDETYQDHVIDQLIGSYLMAAGSRKAAQENRQAGA